MIESVRGAFSVEVFGLCSYSHISFNHLSCSSMLAGSKVGLCFQGDLEVARSCAVYPSDSLQSISNKLIGDGFVME